jgi:hypothetical protein
MLEMAAAAGAIDLYYADESGCCQWTPVSYSYYFEGEQKRQEQTRKRGKRLSILGLWQPQVTFAYSLVLGSLKSEDYIAMLNQQAEAAAVVLAETGRIRVIVQDNGSIHTSKVTIEEGAERFKRWLRKARKIYGDVIGTIRNHLPEICNYFESRTTNGAMEGINNRIKLIKRQAYGFTNFDNFRIRLLACFSNKEKLSPC